MRSLWIVFTFFSNLALADVSIQPDEQQLVRVTTDYYENEFTDVRVWVNSKNPSTVLGLRVKDYPIEALRSLKIFSPIREKTFSIQEASYQPVSLRDVTFMGVTVQAAQLKILPGFRSQSGGPFEILLLAHAPGHYFSLPFSLNLTAQNWSTLYQTSQGSLNVDRAELKTRYVAFLPDGIKKVILKSKQGINHAIEIP